MGYTTYFDGQIEITPKLPAKLTKYINAFGNTRRMKRSTLLLEQEYKGKFGFNSEYGAEGEYFVGGKGLLGQNYDATVININEPPSTQPGLWCHWEITDDGKFIQWSGAEKFYDAREWMKYIIENFIGKKHKCNGVIHAQGEDSDDVWDLIVEDNLVRINY
jgi:hypothetical protein